MRAKEFTINVPINIVINDDECEVKTDAAPPAPTNNTNSERKVKAVPEPIDDHDPAMVPPLQQSIELQKAAVGKDSTVIRDLVANELPEKELTESQEWNWNHQNEDEWFGTYVAPDGSAVDFTALKVGDNNDWEISWMRDGRHRESDPTDQKTLWRIVDNVRKMARQFVQTIKPDVVYVTALGDHRKMELYTKMLSTLGYTASEEIDNPEEYNLAPEYDWYAFTESFAEQTSTDLDTAWINFWPQNGPFPNQ